MSTPESRARTERQPPILIALDALPPGIRWQIDADISGDTGEAATEAAKEAAGEQVEMGELLTVVVVMAANVVRDIRENIRNLVGGRMTHYERLIQGAVDSALADLQTKARNQGYDGVVGVKISHPTVVEGGVEVIAYGNGVRVRRPQHTPDAQAADEADEAGV